MTASTTFKFSIFIIILWFTGIVKASGQLLPLFSNNYPIVVDSILIAGNKKTKDYIIRRELKIKKGDTLYRNNFIAAVNQSRQLVYNTNLFTEVKIESTYNDSAHVVLYVSVKEKWYIYPIPQFLLVDRNFNEWLNTYHASLKRVTYGAKFAHYNFSGRRDPLRIYLLNGYQRNITISYASPYSNPKLTEGFGVQASFTQTQELSIQTNYDNKQITYKRPGYIYNNFSTGAFYTQRKGYYNRRTFSAGIESIQVKDSLFIYHPDYLNTTSNSVTYPRFEFSYKHTDVNNINYPLTGLVYGVNVLKLGFQFKGGINLLQMNPGIAAYIRHGKGWYSSIQLAGLLKLPFQQPYINQRALGYKEFYMKGLEYYVVDAVATGLASYTLKKRIVSFSLPIPIKNKIIDQIPFRIFAKTYANTGYAYNQAPYINKLNNKLLYTGGFGIDLVTLYDITFSVEYSFNQLGEKGLFLHSKGGF